MKRAGIAPINRPEHAGRCTSDINCPDVFSDGEETAAVIGKVVDPLTLVDQFQGEERDAFMRRIAELGPDVGVVVLENSVVIAAMQDPTF